MTTITKQLMTRHELAAYLNVSTRTLDRLRARGVDLGEVRFTPLSSPRFDVGRVSKQLSEKKFRRKKK